MGLKSLLFLILFVNVVQPLSLRKPESSIDSSSNDQGHSVLKLSEDVQILGEDGPDAVQKIVQRVERKLRNSRHREASSRASSVRSNPKKMATKYEDSVAAETKNTSHEAGRQIQQWQVAVVVPPGHQQPGGPPPPMQAQVSQGTQSPPGSIWIQIPGYYSHNTPNYYHVSPTPVEKSPPMPSEENPQTNNNEQPSNGQAHNPDNENHNISPMLIDENYVAPEEEANDNSEVASVPENELSPPNEAGYEYPPEPPKEDNLEHSVNESNDQNQPEMESENSEDPAFVNNNGEDTPAEETSQNENQYLYPTPAEDQNTLPQGHKENHDSTNMNNQEEAMMPPKMNMSPKQQENTGQMNGGEPGMTGQEQSSNSGGTDNGQNEVTSGSNNGVEEMPSSTVSIAETAYYCSRGQYPSENSCSKFINCWDGKAYEQDCPAGLLFSTEGFCDFKENVNCGYRPNEGPKNITDCSIPYGTYRNPTNCSEFFVCVYRTPIKFACPYGLKYNNEIGVCDYPYKVYCYDAPIYYPQQESTTWLPQPAPEEERYPENGEVGGVNNGIDESGSSPASVQPTEQNDYWRTPAGLVDTGLKCRSGSVIPLGKGCGRVSVCAPGGYSQLITCPQHTAYDAKVKRCISAVKAKC